MKYNFDRIIDRSNSASVKFDLRSKIFGNETVMPMWFADMDFETPDFIRDAISKRAEHPVYGYTFRDESYYRAIVEWMESHHNWQITQTDIVFTPGVVPALNFAILAFTQAGDNIIIQPPVYHPFFGAVKDHGRKLIFNHLIRDGVSYKMNFKLLEEQAQRAKMLILSNPHNPVGRCWTKAELEEMAAICLKNNVLILSDEIHADLVLPGYQHQVLANLSPEIASICLTAHAPSKTFNLAGLATSSMIITNAEHRVKFQGIVDHLHLGLGNLFGAIASTAAYSMGEPWRIQLIDYVKDNIHFADEFIKEYLPQIEVSPTEATYMMWLGFAKYGLESDELQKKMIHEAGLGLNSGTDFGPGGGGFMRMNVACPRVKLEEALLRLKSAFSA